METDGARDWALDTPPTRTNTNDTTHDARIAERCCHRTWELVDHDALDAPPRGDATWHCGAAGRAELSRAATFCGGSESSSAAASCRPWPAPVPSTHDDHR